MTGGAEELGAVEDVAVARKPLEIDFASQLLGRRSPRGLEHEAPPGLASAVDRRAHGSRSRVRSRHVRPLAAGVHELGSETHEHPLAPVAGARNRSAYAEHM